MLTATDYKVTRGIERLELQRLIDAGELTQEEADGRQLARDRINVARAAKFGGDWRARRSRGDGLAERIPS